MPARGIQHVDLAVADVDRSLAFYRELLGPLGLKDSYRLRSYRGTEDVLYLRFGDSFLGLRPADGGSHQHYEVGLEHLAFQVDTREEVDEAYKRCLGEGVRIESPPERHYAYIDDQDYYAFFAFDPDGFRIEVVCDRKHAAEVDAQQS
jgi:catechol 2,3-dioxygenase-like lactoylglutathione lyase family enzyme